MKKKRSKARDKQKNPQTTQKGVVSEKAGFVIPIINTVVTAPPVRTSRPKINLHVCKNSYNCIVYCPHNAITKDEKGRPVIDYGLCTGCLICLRECPTGAIFEERE